MYEITVPRLNSNDTSYLLIEWLYADGAVVPDGAEVAVVETSKAAEELTSARGGVLQHAVPVAQECSPGAVIGRVFPTSADRDRYLDEDRDGPGAGASSPEPVITEPALALMARHGIDRAAVLALDQKRVGRSDIERLIRQREGTPVSRVLVTPRGQRAVADAVARSHTTIPAAFAAVRVGVSDALAGLRARAGRLGGQAGLPELLLTGVGRLHDRFPLFFARLDADGNAVLSPTADIGVTVDVGRGLFVPVLRDVARADVGVVADRLMEYRLNALRGEFQERELAGAAIGVRRCANVDQGQARLPGCGGGQQRSHGVAAARVVVGDPVRIPIEDRPNGQRVAGPRGGQVEVVTKVATHQEEAVRRPQRLE